MPISRRGLLAALLATGLLPARQALALTGEPYPVFETDADQVEYKFRRRDVDYSTGIAIASGFRPNAETHIEMVRYGRGQDFMALMGTLLVGGKLRRAPRVIRKLTVRPSKSLKQRLRN